MTRYVLESGDAYPRLVAFFDEHLAEYPEQEGENAPPRAGDIRLFRGSTEICSTPAFPRKPSSFLATRMLEAADQRLWSDGANGALAGQPSTFLVSIDGYNDTCSFTAKHVEARDEDEQEEFTPAHDEPLEYPVKPSKPPKNTDPLAFIFSYLTRQQKMDREHQRTRADADARFQRTISSALEILPMILQKLVVPIATQTPADVSPGPLDRLLIEIVTKIESDPALVGALSAPLMERPDLLPKLQELHQYIVFMRERAREPQTTQPAQAVPSPTPASEPAKQEDKPVN